MPSSRAAPRSGPGASHARQSDPPSSIGTPRITSYNVCYTKLLRFLAERGTPVHAAADGVVTFAGYHRQYGYSVDIDHGNDLVTRYAHLAKLFVKRGDIVQRGLV